MSAGSQNQSDEDDLLIDQDAIILVTGANGFIGSRVVASLLERGFNNLRCFTRPSSNLAKLERLIESHGGAKIEVVRGDLLSVDDCEGAIGDVSVVYHLAAGMVKSFSEAYRNSVDATKNLLDATVKSKSVKRFVNVSSFTVYSNRTLSAGALLDETCPMEEEPRLRGEAYCYGKVKQEEIVREYGEKHDLPYIILRPGVVYGPGRSGITGRVGLSARGVFAHLGGTNKIPLTFVDNCADAIVAAGLKQGIDKETFNVVDDELPTSREFLGMYKKNVKKLRSFYVPKLASYFVCYLSEKYSQWSKKETPPALNTRRWCAEWKGNTYSNEKLKRFLDWEPRVSLAAGLKAYFEYCTSERMN